MFTSILTNLTWFLAVGAKYFDDALSQKTFSDATYIYLLLDPNLMSANFDDLTFEEFFKAVFYIGRGGSSRPNDHCNEARKSWERRTLYPDHKERKIRSIWHGRKPVIMLQWDFKLHTDDSYAIESAMIFSKKSQGLENKHQGYPKHTVNWGDDKRAHLGQYVLMMIYDYGKSLVQRYHLISRENQILDSDAKMRYELEVQKWREEEPMFDFACSGDEIRKISNQLKECQFNEHMAKLEADTKIQRELQKHDDILRFYDVNNSHICSLQTNAKKFLYGGFEIPSSLVEKLREAINKANERNS
ncbi:hypothetical protein PENTCL1PPCAC_20889 [Pristionchus entomophagus]|uniref:Uncharacterized protein n=1 Tax=Pristionchus entomophagus TaxID=358040 RepID=A0AAV5TW34_9BILA|nr:hypothetical protein PENTCL1PPCAC_20889 [Pristionchus entomophagus]